MLSNFSARGGGVSIHREHLQTSALICNCRVVTVWRIFLRNDQRSRRGTRMIYPSPPRVITLRLFSIPRLAAPLGWIVVARGGVVLDRRPSRLGRAVGGRRISVAVSELLAQRRARLTRVVLRGACHLNCRCSDQRRAKNCQNGFSHSNLPKIRRSVAKPNERRFSCACIRGYVNRGGLLQARDHEAVRKLVNTFRLDIGHRRYGAPLNRARAIEMLEKGSAVIFA